MQCWIFISDKYSKLPFLQVVLIRDLLMFLFFSSCNWTPHFCLLFSNTARFPIIMPWWRTCWRFSFVIKACRERAGIVSTACLSFVFRNGAFSLRLCSVVRHQPHSGPEFSRSCDSRNSGAVTLKAPFKCFCRWTGCGFVLTSHRLCFLKV